MISERVIRLIIVEKEPGGGYTNTQPRADRHVPPKIWSLQANDEQGRRAEDKKPLANQTNR